MGLQNPRNGVVRVNEGSELVVRPVRGCVVERDERSIRFDGAVMCVLHRGLEGCPVGLLEGRHVEVFEGAKRDCGQIKVFVVHAVRLWGCASPVLHPLKVVVFAKGLM